MLEGRKRKRKKREKEEREKEEREKDYQRTKRRISSTINQNIESKEMIITSSQVKGASSFL